MDVLGVHTRLEKGISHVNFSKEFSLAAVCKNVIDAGEGEIVADRVSIEGAVVIDPSGFNGEVRYAVPEFGDTEGR